MSGMYIMQREKIVAGEKIRNKDLVKKIKRGKEKLKKITLKKGEKALKMHLFGL